MQVLRMLFIGLLALAGTPYGHPALGQNGSPSAAGGASLMSRFGTERIIRLRDGRNMAIRCSGQGSPVVILEAGRGGGVGSLSWLFVQPQVATFTRVCSYDRAGNFRSDAGPLPRDGEHIVDDLHALLSLAGEKPPYVLVGHSWGGLLIRQYASQFRSELRGMVFVDPTVRSVFEGPIGLRRRARWERIAQQCLMAATARQILPGGDADCLPPQGFDTPEILALYQRPATWTTQLSEFQSFDKLLASIEAAERRPYAFPLIVLSGMNQPDPGISEAQNEAEMQKLVEGHRRLAALSPAGLHRRIADASHYVHTERPEVVVAAIRDVLSTK